MGSDLKIALETEMEKMKQANRLARGDFVSDKYLDKLFTIKNLKGNLRPLLPPTWMGFREPMELGQLANNVRNSAQRLYAILLLMDQSPRIIPLLSYDPPVDDKFLFGSPDDPKDNLITFCSLKRLLLSPLEDIAEEFYNKQWHCPPQLSDSITHEFPPDLYIYPFTGPPINIGGGGYGAVQKVDIAKGYLEHPNAYQNVNKIRIKAYH
jgi:hypothetical protein